MDEIARFIQYLQQSKEACLLEAETLTADAREDEGILSKIRANIFDIMIAVSRTAQKRADQSAIPLIREKMETLPTAWQASLAAAEKHGDQRKAALERVKLQALAEIGEQLADILEAAQ